MAAVPLTLTVKVAVSWAQLGASHTWIVYVPATVPVKLVLPRPPVVGVVVDVSTPAPATGSARTCHASAVPSTAGRVGPEYRAVRASGVFAATAPAPPAGATAVSARSSTWRAKVTGGGGQPVTTPGQPPETVTT